MLLWLAYSAPAVAASSPPNDDFADAQLLSGALPIEVSGTNVGATAQAGEPGHSPLASAGHTIWFRWQPTSTEAVTISTCGSNRLTVLGVYVGSTLNALTEVADNTPEAGCGLDQGTQATFRAVAGTTYSIQVDGNNFHDAGEPPVSGEGAIDLHIREQSPPGNDDFVDAQPLQVGPETVPAPNLGASKESGEPNHRGDPGGASVWFKWTAPRTGGALVQVDGGPVGHRSLVAVYTGASVGSLTAVPGIESWGSSELAFPVVAGVTYRIAVDGKYNPSTETAFMDEPEISLSMYPVNDDFEKPFGFPTASFVGTFGLGGLGSAGATKQPGEPDHAGNRGGASVWFAWRASEAGSVGLSACPASFHTLLAVYTGSNVASLTPVAASSNPPSPSCSGPYEVSFNVDAGTTYRIAVDGYEGAWGTFGIALHTSKERLASPHHSSPPRTRIVGRRLNRPHGIAVFHLRSSEPDSNFVCKLDSRPFVACPSTIAYRKLKPGRHIFKSKAVNSSGEPDSTPAVFHFRIARP